MSWRNPDRMFAHRARDYAVEHGVSFREARIAVSRFDDENHPNRGLARDERGAVVRTGRKSQPVERSGRGGGSGGSGSGGGTGGGAGGGTEAHDPGNVRALFPWLPNNLATMLADLWAEHGDMGLALGHLRQTDEHKHAFPGIRREDGSLRYTEQGYFQAKQGYRAAVTEFGFDPDEFDLVGLFENEVSPDRFARSLFETADLLTAPGQRRHEGLLRQFTSELTKSGSASLALDAVRDSADYKQLFPGIRREDGSLVMSERDYFAHREGFRRELRQYGLNPAPFEGHHADLIQGEVGLDEFRQRIGAKITGVKQNLPQVRQEFGRFYGIEGMSDTALIGAALDPDVGLGLLQGRITAAQVSAEASAAGFVRSRTQAERLAQGGGLDQAGARQLFSQAAQAVPRTQRLAERFNEDREFGIEEFEEAAVFGNADEQRRMERLHASERALGRQGGQVQRDRTGLSGLRQR